jgi:hypothetical protein
MFWDNLKNFYENVHLKIVAVRRAIFKIKKVLVSRSLGQICDLKGWPTFSENVTL